ncbi:MAG: tyrosine recombinase XerC [Clostridia bacterium]|nr:tyrosine recombinase XerC [Clostridia bacterium]
MPYTVNIEEFPAVLREFASYKSVIQGCSDKTVSEYLSDLRTFFRWLRATEKGLPTQGEDFDKIEILHVDVDYIKGITTDRIYEFLVFTGTVRGNAGAAKARKLSAIKALYKYLTVKRHLLETNPAADIETPKKKKALPKHLSLEECRVLLDAIKNDTASPNRVRDWCMITLFLNCGMRVSELSGINLPDLDREYRSLRVIGKGNKERIIYLNDSCRAALSQYMQVRMQEKYKKNTDKALFLSERCQRISVKTIQYTVYKYLDLAGLGAKHYSVHKLRHTAATLMYQSGDVDVRVLKEILGHEQLNTTQIYTHVANKDMEKAMSANPLAGEGGLDDE